MTATAATYQRSIDKSRKLDPTLSRVKHLGGVTYEVAGEHGVYRAYARGGNFRCSCEASRRDAPCWHLGSLWRLKVAEKAAS